MRGVLAIRGIKDGAVLQREESGACRVTLEARFQGRPRASLGELTEVGRDRWSLSGIRAGGPYAVTIEDGKESRTFFDLYVGDLWLLAGQSNMEGAGVLTPEDEEESASRRPYLRALYMDDHWDAAGPVLHQLFLSRDRPHREAWERDRRSLEQRGIEVYDAPPYRSGRHVGPGYFFAKEMFRLTGGIPQGLIPAAVGGAPIESWLPPAPGEENYYTAACRRIVETGSHIRGVFWSQGEGNPHADCYPAQIERMRRDLCERLKASQIPFVQMQSFKCTLQMDAETDERWSRFREMQRKMPFQAERLATIATNDLALDDCIHLSSDSQKVCGVRAARAMHWLITGIGTAEPALDTLYAVRDRFVPHFSEIHIRYRNLSGALTSSGVPFGFTLRRKGSGEAPSIQRVRKILTAQNEAILCVERTIEELADYELWYGYGNGFYCNVVDQGNRAIPAMGPIDLKEYLQGGRME